MVHLSILSAAAVKSNWVPEFLFSILPFILVCSLLVYLLHSNQKRHQRYLDRSMCHMDSLDKKADRVIELLEEINKRK